MLSRGRGDPPDHSMGAHRAWLPSLLSGGGGARGDHSMEARMATTVSRAKQAAGRGTNKTPARKAAKKATGKTPAKKAVARSAPAKKAVARNAVAKKVAAKKVAPKEVAAKKVAAKKVAPKRVAAKKAHISPGKALANTRRLLEAKQAHDRETPPWQALEARHGTAPHAGFQDGQARDQANELHAGESHMEAIQGASGTQDRHNQGKRDKR